MKLASAFPIFILILLACCLSTGADRPKRCRDDNETSKLKQICFIRGGDCPCQTNGPCYKETALLCPERGTRCCQEVKREKMEPEELELRSAQVLPPPDKAEGDSAPMCGKDPEKGKRQECWFSLEKDFKCPCGEKGICFENVANKCPRKNQYCCQTQDKSWN